MWRCEDILHWLQLQKSADSTLPRFVARSRAMAVVTKTLPKTITRETQYSVHYFPIHILEVRTRTQSSA